MDRCDRGWRERAVRHDSMLFRDPEIPPEERLGSGCPKEDQDVGLDVGELEL